VKRVGIALFLALAAASAAVVSAQSGTIRACVSGNGNIRIVGAGESCGNQGALLIWNADGVPGPAGPQGPAGPAGPQGPEGPAGRDGRDATGPGEAEPTVTLQMTVDGMNGDDPTPIFSFSLGATNTGTTSGGGGSGAGRVSFQDLAVSKQLDGMSVDLLSAAATGEHIPDVKIEVFAIGSSSPFATYTFRDALVTAVVFGASNQAPAETVSFNFTRVISDVTVGGTTFHSCFDILKNVKC
jgi:type VI protein secretion system component Hcp